MCSYQPIIAAIPLILGNSIENSPGKLMSSTGNRIVTEDLRSSGRREELSKTEIGTHGKVAIEYSKFNTSKNGSITIASKGSHKAEIRSSKTLDFSNSKNEAQEL